MTTLATIPVPAIFTQELPALVALPSVDGIWAQIASVVSAPLARVTDAAGCEAAYHMLREIKTIEKAAEECLDYAISEAHRRHKMLTSRRAALLDPLRKRFAEIEVDARRWTDEQLRIELARQRAAEEAARKAEEDRQKAEAAELERQAAALAAAGKAQEAEAVFAEAIEVAAAPLAPPPPVRIQTEIPKVTGVSKVVVTWRYRIIDASMVPRRWLVPDEQSIARHVKVCGAAHGIPGIEAYPEETRRVSAY